MDIAEMQEQPLGRKRAAVITVAVLFLVGLGLFVWGIAANKLPWQTANSGSTMDDKHYPIHKDITATVFWVGEGANSSNDFIHNRSSYWVDDWVGAYGGVDDPRSRCEYGPCGFTPQENPFYFALPYGERLADGSLRPADELEVIPWYEESRASETHILKNRWIKIMHDGMAAYAQWQDVGPYGENDAAYVFGGERPADPRSGIDISPATADYLAIDGQAQVDWQFIEADEIPEGPWAETITRSGPEL